MGWALYLRPHTNKHGKNDIFYRVTSVDGQIKKTIPNCKVRPEDFNKRTNQVNGRSDNATIINETLNATTTYFKKDGDYTKVVIIHGTNLNPSWVAIDQNTTLKHLSILT